MRQIAHLLLVTTVAAACTTTTQGVISDTPPGDTLVHYEILTASEPLATDEEGRELVAIDPITQRPVGALDGDLRFELGSLPLELKHLGDRLRWTAGDESVLWVGETPYALQWVDIHSDGDGIGLTFVHQDEQERVLHVRAQITKGPTNSILHPLVVNAPTSTGDEVVVQGLGLDLGKCLPRDTRCTTGEDAGTLLLANPLTLSSAQIEHIAAAIRDTH